MEAVHSAVSRGAAATADRVVSEIPASAFRASDKASFPAADFGKKSVSEDRLKDAVNQANSLSKMFDRSLKFEYRQEADIYQVSVIDTSKDEVVRKIPPDEVVRFIESIKDLFGAMLDLQA
jgi:uncharacterized FlaG/YvyC family protein